VAAEHDVELIDGEGYGPGPPVPALRRLLDACASANQVKPSANSD